MIFKWSEGFMSRGVKPAAAARAIEAKRRSLGRGLHPSDVVEAAESKNSALHPLFTWDDTEAARKCRLSEASSVLRALVTIEPNQSPVRSWVSVTEPKVGRVYVPIAQAMSDERMREQVLDEALASLRSWHLRYGTFRECAGLANDVQLVLKKYQEAKKV